MTWLGIQFPSMEGQYDYIFRILGHSLCMDDTQDANLKKNIIILCINFMLPFYLMIDDSEKILLMFQGC